MCEPTTILAVGLALSAASAAASYAGQAQSAKAQGKFQNAQYSDTARAALGAFQRTISQSAREVDQESAATADQAMQLRNAAGQAMGAGRASAAERGVTGDSIETLLGDYARIESVNAFNLETNLGWFKGQIAENLEGVRAGNQSRVSSVAPRPIQGHNAAAALFGFGASALNSYDNYAKQTKSGPYSP